jgi:hypothetical protein
MPGVGALHAGPRRSPLKLPIVPTHAGLLKTLHILQVLHDKTYRRMIVSQKNLHESRHSLARKVRHGDYGLLRERYREGMEDQLGALGLMLNCVVLWNTIYMDKARAQRQAAGRPIPDEILAGLSPLIHEHLNFSGRYPLQRACPRPAAARSRHARGRGHLNRPRTAKTCE